MAEPARKPVYDDHDNRPVTRPNLRILEGGRQTSPPTGKLSEDRKDAESNTPESNELNKLGRGYNENDKGVGVRGRLANKAINIGATIKRNKKKTIGGVIGGLLVGGGIFGFSILQGPLQFVHLAQILQKYHFSSNFEATDSRFGKLSRYIYHRSNDEVYKTRLGYFQNRYADRIAENLRKAGVESEYNSRFGFKERTRIDPEFYGERNLTPEEIKSRLESDFKGTKVTIEDGEVYVNNKDMGNFRNRAFERNVLKKAGYTRVFAAVNGRVMSTRAGYVLHPLRKLDRKALEKFDEAFEKWKNDRREKIGKGSDSVRVTVGNKEGDNPDDPNDDGSHQEGERRASEGRDEIQKFTQSGKFRLGVGATAFLGVGCLLRSLDEGYDGIKEQQTILPAIRMAMDAISLGAQVQAGDDFSVHQLEFMHRTLHGKDSRGEKSSFNQAKSLLAEEGKKDNGVNESGALKSIGSRSPFEFTNQGVVGTALDGACSTAGQIALGVIGFLAGPVSAGAGEAFQAAFGDDLQKLALDMIKGESIDPLAVGADFGNTVNYGARLAANSQASSNGGRPLSTDEERQLASLRRELDQKDFSNKTFFARMFDAYDHRSLIGSAIGSLDPSIGENIQNFASSIFGLKPLASGLSSMVTPSTHADNAVYDYGFDEVGFSVNELENAEVENPYKNAEEVITQILPANEEYIERAEKCFKVMVDETTYDVTPSLDESPSFEDVNSDECRDTNSGWMRVRFYIFDSITSMNAACYEGDDEACSQLGVESTSASESSVVSGNVQELAQELLDLADDRKIDIDNYYSENPASDEADRSTPRKQLEDLADGEPAKGSTRCGHNNANIEPDVKILQFLVDLGRETNYTINSLFGQCHSSTSLHYQGKAVDFGCGLDLNKADAAGRPYDVVRNFETCAGHGHWHYSVGGG